jgi:hypothetical protein
MYFPYLRGKQYEIAAVKEMVPVLRTSGKVVPIIEPVIAKPTKKNPVGLTSIEELAGTGIEMIMIANPQKGKMRGDHSVLDDFLGGLMSSNLLAGYIVGPKTDPKDVRAFLERQTVREAAIIHWGGTANPDSLAKVIVASQKVAYQVFVDGKSSTRYIHAFAGAGRAILLADGFQRKDRNTDYSEDKSFFSDLHRTFGPRGYDGFGDFLMIGDHYREGGGQALAVALHLTNREQGDDIYCHHFLSDDTEGLGVNTAGKFLEALTKACRFINSPENFLITEGCRDYLDLYKRQHFPQLGPLKKMSLKHHMELLASLLGPARRKKK